MINPFRFLAVFFSLFVLLGCDQSKKTLEPKRSAHALQPSLSKQMLDAAERTGTPTAKKYGKVYFGGPILTMVGDVPKYAEALVVEDDMIVFVGELNQALQQFPYHAKEDLQGMTLLPGLIDGHSHFAGFPAQAVGAILLPSPDADVDDIPRLIETLKAWATPENLALNGWIFGMGFDDSQLAEKRFPTRDDLDQVSTEHPIMAIHISGHFASLNSQGLKELGIDANTPNPEGGVIRRYENSTEPNGVLEELAAIPFMSQVISPKTAEAAQLFLQSGLEMALSYGYTTIQEGRAFADSHEFLKQAANSHALTIDVVSYIDYSADHLLETSWYGRGYKNNYRIGGVKLTLDGSPQGRTAWKSKPYLIPPEGADEDYAGYPVIPSDEDVIAIYERSLANGWQILTHANGDAAMDQMLRTYRKAFEKFPQKDRRDVLIHGQYVRPDQLPQFHELGFIASLFPLHTFYWGDWHEQLLGKERVKFISPTRAALNLGMPLTIHTDAPVALPNLMRVVWTAVSRTSRSGQSIGEDQRLTVYEALQAITIWSAYQHFEETSKGSLEVGKLADLVVLDHNPLDVDIDEIKNIQVVKTIKSGAEVYSKIMSTKSSDQTKMMPGSDRDEHGCIGSAGYQWCARLKTCERPWELAEMKNINNDLEAFKTFCQSQSD